MVTTKVLNQSTGCWSDDIKGLDKEFFVKSILSSCFYRSDLYNPTSLGFTCDLTDANRVIERLELDFHSVNFNDILRVAYYHRYKDEDTGNEDIVELLEEGEYAKYKLSWAKVNTDIHALMVGIGVLKNLMADYKKQGEDYLIPIVETIIKAGNVPTDASDDYVLVLKFE